MANKVNNVSPKQNQDYRSARARLYLVQVLNRYAKALEEGAKKPA